jgi:ribosomal protein S7
MNQFILDQPGDDQIEMLEWAAAEALPRYASQTPRVPQAASASAIDTSGWRRPQDSV